MDHYDESPPKDHACKHFMLIEPMLHSELLMLWCENLTKCLYNLTLDVHDMTHFSS